MFVTVSVNVDFNVHLQYRLLFLLLLHNNVTLYSAVKSKEPPIQGTNNTKIWFNEKGLIAFATTLDWLQVKSLYSGFSNRTCRYMGKVKDVIPKERRVTAQGLFDEYVSVSTHARSQNMYTCFYTLLTQYIQLYTYLALVNIYCRLYPCMLVAGLHTLIVAPDSTLSYILRYELPTPENI